MFRYTRNIAYVLRGRVSPHTLSGLNCSQPILSRSISSTFPNFKNPLDRLLSKPVLYDEDTDDELDDELKPRERMARNDPFAESDEEEESDEEVASAPQLRVGKELLKLGRVPYRHIEKLPEWISQRKQEISEHRTPNQIRRCLKNWMLKPDRELQRKYAGRSLGWMDSAPSDASKEASRVMAYGPEETVAYLNYFFPSRFTITKRIFNEVGGPRTHAVTLLMCYQPLTDYYDVVAHWTDENTTAEVPTTPHCGLWVWSWYSSSGGGGGMGRGDGAALLGSGHESVDAGRREDHDHRHGQAAVAAGSAAGG